MFHYQKSSFHFLEPHHQLGGHALVEVRQHYHSQYALQGDLLTKCRKSAVISYQDVGSAMTCLLLIMFVEGSQHVARPCTASCIVWHLSQLKVVLVDNLITTWCFDHSEMNLVWRYSEFIGFLMGQSTCTSTSYLALVLHPAHLCSIKHVQPSTYRLQWEKRACISNSGLYNSNFGCFSSILRSQFTVLVFAHRIEFCPILLGVHISPEYVASLVFLCTECRIVMTSRG